MKTLTLKEIDEVRKTGYRPSVICCCVHDKKVLFLYKKEFSMWMFPQSSVRNKEELVEAAGREIREELGESFAKNCNSADAFAFGEDMIEFLPEKQNLEELKTDDGQECKMLGKKYFYCAVAAKDETLNISETQYDDHYWLEFQPAMFLAKKIHQPGKRRITMKALELLKSLDLIG
ncbi:hypothetical protein A2415_00770 [candidate division WWE3 bacterium RIFOXYC1_FULL_39_7]|uniref:Nudix hydrolase domain-containing protein n=2 Tax=Katanobacteria TaxID=422282 RepID=A0A1F4X6F9_UNCKA|nr:MAG: hypothetical protein A2415_00770 [candidate division WWE3 bacterium RIFOXYC1_FULL_39_7]OGC77257.1 MAG: hypothetical protein A2619_00600 [candidate division WWE3 bacterium RIFOXYD1_FULL_39_9]